MDTVLSWNWLWHRSVAGKVPVQVGSLVTLACAESDYRDCSSVGRAPAVQTEGSIPSNFNFSLLTETSDREPPLLAVPQLQLGRIHLAGFIHVLSKTTKTVG